MTEESRHPAEAWVGRVVADKYRITRVLGIGGHGAVFEAQNTWTERRVALKLLVGPSALHPEIAERFLREARASTRVAHPNIVEVLDMGRDAADGTLYIVQELLHGEDLRELLRRERTLDPHQLIEVLAPVMDALATAHGLGVVHRDLKPANIFLSRGADGRIVSKLIDFGVSRMGEGAGETNELTHTGALLGTPDYMSPEQARGERSGPSADVWAIGVVLYESLAGQRPYRAANYNALLIKILADDVPPLTSFAPGVDPALAEIIHGALARDLAARWRSMAALREALLRWAASAPRRASAGDVTPSVQSFPAIDAGDVTPVSISPPAMIAEAPASEALPRSMPVSGPRSVEPVSFRDQSHFGYGSPAAGDDTNESPMGEVVSPRSFPSHEVVDAAPPQGAPPTPSLPPVAVAPSRSRLPVAIAALIAAALVASAIVYVARPAPREERRPEAQRDAAVHALALAALSGADATVAPSAARVEAVVDASPRAIGDAAALAVEDVSSAAVDVGDRDSAPTESEASQATRGGRVVRPVAHPVRPALPTRDLPESAEIRAVFNGMTPAVRNCMAQNTGTVLVAATLVSTGRVERVQVSAPWAGTPSGACITAIVSRVRVAPFRQDRFTFSWPYVIPVAPGGQR